MDLLEHIRLMAGYNAWANARTYDAAAALTDAAYRADRGAFFRSVHGTLNHLLATDRIWLWRMTGEAVQTPALDAILFDDLAPLRQARTVEDARLVAFADALGPADLARAIRYRRVSTPDIYEQPLAPALVHLFNHQTHHRGQVHAILTGLGAKGPELDLLFYERTLGLGARQVGG